MRQTKDLEFTGSTPVRDTIYASVAQLDVQHPSKVKVAGSSPVGSAINRLIDAIGRHS